MMKHFIVTLPMYLCSLVNSHQFGYCALISSVKVSIDITMCRLVLKEHRYANKPALLRLYNLLYKRLYNPKIRIHLNSTIHFFARDMGAV